MKKNWEEFREIIHIITKNLVRFIKYQLITKAIMFIILMPFLKWTFNMLMNNRGYTYLTNELLKSFMLSPQGFLLVILAVTIGLIVGLLEIGGMVVLSHQVLNHQKESSYLSIAKYSLSRVKYLLGIDGVLVLVYLFFIGPLISSSTTTSIFEKLKIPGFIMDVINSNELFSLYWLILLLVAGLLSIRWMFAIQVIMLTDRHKKRALKQSWYIVKKNFLKIIKYIFVMDLFGILLMILITLLVLIVFVIIIILMPEAKTDTLIVMGINIFIVGTTGFAFVAVPFQSILMTKCFENIYKYPVEVNIKAASSNKKWYIKWLDNKWIIGTLIVIIATVNVAGLYLIQEESINHSKSIIGITSHRGNSTESPENTLASIDSAILSGATHAEIDVQETKDGHVILLHDKSFLRTTGVDLTPWEMTLDEIKTLDAGSYYDASYSSEKIPTLEEIMTYSRGRIKLNIEVKSNSHDKKLVASIVNSINELDYYDECVVTSLDYSVIEEVELLDSKIRTGYIMIVALGELEKLNVDFYSVEESNINETFISNAHKINREVHVWTLNTDESMRNAIALRVDNIITDEVTLLKSIIDEKIDIFDFLKYAFE